MLNNEVGGNHEISFFESLFHEYYRQLLTYTFRLVNDRQAAEDIVQDVFFALWNRRDSICFEKPIKSYLYKAAYNKSINYINSYFVQCRLENIEEIDHLLNLEIYNLTPQDSFLEIEVTMEVNKIVATLPPQRRKVFQLSRLNKIKNKEIARELGISEKTVEKHISKALSDIRDYLIKIGLMFFLF